MQLHAKAFPSLYLCRGGGGEGGWVGGEVMARTPRVRFALEKKKNVREVCYELQSYLGDTWDDLCGVVAPVPPLPDDSRLLQMGQRSFDVVVSVFPSPLFSIS